MDASPVTDALRAALPGVGVEVTASFDMPTIVVDRAQLVDVCRVLRDDPALQFALLVDVTAVDNLPAEPRYDVVYHLACVGPAYAQPAGPAPARRLRLKVRVPGTDTALSTVSGIWPAANWLEREVFDLFGLVFEGHPDLRRILMTDDWEGHPLRKDYPVQIRKETSWALPLQVTPEQFAANVRTVRENAVDQSRQGPFDERRRETESKRRPDA